MENNNKTVFIITPIGGDSTAIRREAEGVIDAAITPSLLQLGFNEENIFVAHRISLSGSINKQIISRIINSDLAIVNLTELNPNVMYELAVRHAARKPVIQICQVGTKLPFDIIDERTIFYTNDMKGVLDLQSQLNSHITSALADEKPDNPIYRSIELDLVLQDNSTMDINLSKYLVKRLDSIEQSLTVATSKSDESVRNPEFKIVTSEIISITDDEILEEIRSLLIEIINPGPYSISKERDIENPENIIIDVKLASSTLRNIKRFAGELSSKDWTNFKVTQIETKF